ncbi:MAG: hypothetical protein ACLSHO_09295 [Dysosmobacter sp.]
MAAAYFLGRAGIPVTRL